MDKEKEGTDRSDTEIKQGREHTEQGREHTEQGREHTDTEQIHQKDDKERMQNNSSDVSHERDNTIRHNEPDTRKETKEIPEEVSEVTEGISEDIQEIIELRQQIQGLIANRWRDLIPANPQDFIFTKEDYELVRSYLTMLIANIDRNIAEWIRNATTDQCNLDRLKQFIVIKKIGTILFQSYAKRIDSILNALQSQTQIMTEYIRQLGIVSQSMANSHILNVGQFPNFAVDIKLATIIATIIAGITATGIEIGNIKNNLRNLIRYNEYCIRGCGQCDTNQPQELRYAGINKIASDQNEYNEGIEYANETEYILRQLERLIQLELEYVEREIKKYKSKKREE